MLDANLITIPVSKLQPGMLIHRIGAQSGSLVVKNKGRMHHPSIIQQLITKGVQTVVVERPVKKRSYSMLELYRKGSSLNHSLTSLLNDDSEKLNNTALVTIEHGYEAASKLLNDLKMTFKAVASQMSKDLPVRPGLIDNSISDIYHMLSTNKDALLFMTLYEQEDKYLYGHAVRCSILLCYFARSMGMPEKDCKRLATIGFLFDIGMITLPAKIRRNIKRTTFEEQLVVQTHVVQSLKLLESIKLDNEQKLAIEQHHERLDGSGYPYGIEGEDIHLYSRMLAIVDCFDAMTSTRSFQKAVTPAAALRVLCNADYGYDQKLAVEFLRAIGIYPRGSGVELNNGEIAIVTKVLPESPLKPVVQSVLSLNKMRSPSPRTIDLSESNLGIGIKKPILLEQYGLNKTAIAH